MARFDPARAVRAREFVIRMLKPSLREGAPVRRGADRGGEVTPPRVSVLIPAYNAAAWIRTTVESALGQTWPNLEIVVVDDGSTDDTAAVVESLGAPAVRVVRQMRSGPSAAQNEALRHAQGDFIQRLDADDVISPDKIARQMARLKDRPRAVAAGQWARFTTDPSEARFRPNSVSLDMAPEEWLRRECTGGGPMLQPGLWLAARGIVDAAGPWNERLTLNNDFDYGVRLLLTSDWVLFCADARLYYRSGNPGSLASQRSPAAWQSTLLSIDLGAAAMLRRSSDDGMRRACADLFQQLAYAAYLDAPDVCREAERHARELGGSTVKMDGGVLFTIMRHAIGWRRAARIKQLAYRSGYARVARAKGAALGRGVGL